MTCSKCSRPLHLRLIPDWEGELRCLDCDSPILVESLSGGIVDRELSGKLKEWRSAVMSVTGTGVHGNLGSGMSDVQYIKAWRSARDMTSEILKALWRFAPARADVCQDVFDTRPLSEWTDEAILRWRDWRNRLRLIQEYGASKAGQMLGRLKDKNEVLARLLEACPPEFHTDEMDSFREGFLLGLAFENPGMTESISESQWRERLGLSSEQ